MICHTFFVPCVVHTLNEAIRNFISKMQRLFRERKSGGVKFRMVLQPKFFSNSKAHKFIKFGAHLELLQKHSSYLDP